MKKIQKNFISLTFYAVITALVILNMLLWENPAFGTILGIVYFSYFGFLTGNIFFHKETFGWKTTLGTLIFCSFFIIIGSITYYLNKFDLLATVLITTIIPHLIIIIQILLNRHPEFNFKTTFRPLKDFLPIILSFFFLFFEISLFYILYKSQIFSAIRSPWWDGVVPREFFALYFISTFLLLSLSLSFKNKILPLFLSCIHFSLSVSVALIVYKLGYGFDAFIHQASEKLIFDSGVITPKTFYYIGQYVFTVTVSRITSLPVVLIDKLLVPIWFSLFIPTTVFFTLRKIFFDKSLNVFISISILVLPFASYIVTTPQAFANLFTLLAVLVSTVYVFGDEKKEWLITSILFVTASTLIHPLAGLPALIFILILLLSIITKKIFFQFRILRFIVLLEIFVLLSFLIPATFLVNSLISKGYPAILHFTSLNSLSSLFLNNSFLVPSFENSFSLIFDIIYLVYNNIFLVLIISAFFSYIIFRKKIKNGWLYTVSFFVLFTNYFVLANFIEFTFLPDFEKANYANRLFEVCILILIPYLLLLVHKITSKALQKGVIFTSSVITFFSILITVSLYTSYPKDDIYHVDRGYNLTQNDIEAVTLVHEHGQGLYAVLSSPVTASAALRQFGFYKYVSESKDPDKVHFYYSIPTGGPLNEYFLQMVDPEKNSKEVIFEAMDFVGVNQIFFIINKYWHDSERIIEKSKQNSDNWYDIKNGQVYVFEYFRDK